MILGFEWISEKIEMIFLLYGICCASTRTYIVSQMSISIGQMNSLLKEYTDTLLTLHGIPLTGQFEDDFQKFAEHVSATTSLKNAMWKLTQQTKADEECINHLTEKNEQLETDFIAEQHRASDNHFKAVRLATTVKDLRDHIADCRGDADERAERYEAILEKADEALKKEFPLPSGKFCRPKKFRDYSPYNTEEEDSDEETDEETDEE